MGDLSVIRRCAARSRMPQRREDILPRTKFAEAAPSSDDTRQLDLLFLIRDARMKRVTRLQGSATPQTPAKAGRLRENRVRGAPARARVISLVQRRRVSRAWRTILPTVLSSKKRSWRLSA